MNPSFSKTNFIAVMLFVFSAGMVHAQAAEPAAGDTTDVVNKIFLDRITVVGAPVWVSQIPGAASYITSEQLQKQSYTDINRVLRSVSGVNLQEEDGFGLRPNIGLRGAGVERSTKVNLMEDGILVAPAPYSAPAAYYFPNIARMSSVEVRKGSSQIKYGPNTTGGAINLISTPIPSELSGRAELSIGERNANRLYANFGNTHQNFGYLIEGLHLGNDGFKKLDNGGDTGFIIRDIQAKFMLRTNPDANVFQRLEFKFGYNDQVSDETYVGLTRDDFKRAPYRRYAGSQVDQINTEHLQLMARHFALFSENVDLTTTLYRNNFSRNWYKLQTVNGRGLTGILNNPSQNEDAIAVLRGNNSEDNALMVRANDRAYYSQGIESILGVNFRTGNLSNQVEFGVRLHQDQEDRFQLEDGYRMENGNMVLTRAGTPGTQANRIGEATALSIFLQNKIRSDRWTFSPGIRYENISFTDTNFGSQDLDRTGTGIIPNEYTITEFMPGFGLTYQLTDSFTLISGIHRGFSPPSPGSSSDTRSEQSVNYELGFRYSNLVVQTELIGFFNNYNNLLGSDLAAGGGGGTTAQFNAGKVHVSGIEFTANLDISELAGLTKVSLPLSMNYTFTNAVFQTDFQSSFGPWGTVSKGDEIPFIPRHQINAALGFGLGDFSANLNSVFAPAMRTIAGSGSPDPNFSTDRYFLLDLSADYTFTSYLNVFVNVRNLLNHVYIVSDRPAGVRPGLPRTLMGGLRFTI
jgi:Fe(3+) dicitrate transport protein